VTSGENGKRLSGQKHGRKKNKTGMNRRSADSEPVTHKGTIAPGARGKITRV